MKTFSKLPLIVIMLFTVGLAWAGGSLLGSNIGTGTAPSSSTAGYALKAAGYTPKGITVTVSDVRDGSVGDALDSVLTVDAYAWCYNASTVGSASTGGAESGWSRMPSLDLSMRVSDAGTGVASTGYHAGLSSTATISTGIDCSRIYYTTGNVNLSYDAGTLVHRVTVTSQQ